MEEQRILLVDDEALALEGLKEGIRWESLGIAHVYTAESKSRAMELLSTIPFQLMISDIEMPGGSGLELIREAKALNPDIICIFYTAHPDFSYCQEALKLGAMDFAVKPIPYTEMEEILRKALDAVRKNKNSKELENIWENLTKPESEAESPVDIVKKLIEQNISAEISRDELAAAVYMNPDYLTRLFRKETGMSISDYIIDKRLSLAKHMLKNTDMSIVDISEKTGFSYSSYFVRLFKKKVGITPQQYREQ